MIFTSPALRIPQSLIRVSYLSSVICHLSCASLLLYVALPLILTGIFGCASIKPTYQGGQTNILNNDAQYKLAAIEFGELGSYGDPYKDELKNTIQLLRNTERPLLVVYIHGW